MFHLQTVLTTKCNLACKYCYINQDNQDMTLDIFKKHFSFIDDLFKQMNNQEKFILGFFGGEPLLKIDLIEEIQRLVQTHSMYGGSFVATNGILLTKENQERLNKLGIGFSVSFDGLWNKTNRVFHDDSSSFDCYQSEDIIDVMKNRGVKSMISPSSVETLVENLEFFVDLGINFPDFTLVRDDVWDDNSIKQFDTNMQKLTNRVIQYWNEEQKFILPGIYSLYLLDTFLSKQGKRPFGCFAGVHGVSLMPSGDIYPCARFGSNQKLQIGNSVSKQINKETINFIKSIHNPIYYSKCKHCELYKVCNVGCYYQQLETGQWKEMIPPDSVCRCFKIIYREAYKCFNFFKDKTEFKDYLEHRMKNSG